MENEPMTKEELFKLFKQQDDGQYEVLGQKFDEIEVADAKDFYCMCDSYGLFNLSRREFVNFLDFNEVMQSVGTRLMLALLIGVDESGIFMLRETDTRILQLSRKRWENEQFGLEWDSPIIIARR